MPRVINVVYENGVFKPIEKVNLEEGKKIKIEIKEENLNKLKGKYKGKGKIDFKLIIDEIYDRKTHFS